MTQTLSAYMKEIASLVEERIACYLECSDPDISSTYEAMLYSAMAGGKRIRPFLCVAVCDMLGGQRDVALTFGAALEMIHTYSLIHDDLPAMDNDDLRRGKPTCHKIFGEAGAILAGDGLLTEAFGLVATAKTDPSVTVEAVRRLSRAAGAYGMIGGQAMDIRAEHEPLQNIETLEKLCHKKTGELISVAGQLGCLAAGFTEGDTLHAISRYTEKIGIVFQMIDDYLDVYAGEEALGKPIGSDAANGKTTFMTFMTSSELLEKAAALTREACEAISDLKGNEMLIALAETLLHRGN